MTDRKFTLEDLRRIVLEGAGSAGAGGLGGDITDTDFEALGYDSLALLETATRIEREYDVKLGDDTVTEARTPGQLVNAVNAALAARAA